ncbi:MAG: hypothetical protein MZV64_32790 [Ignavibacteriales bacterium]|nr:hypothetical protein [Ignavibacteriales bacterium]
MTPGNGLEAHYTERLLRRRRLPASLPATSAASASPGADGTGQGRLRPAVPRAPRRSVVRPAQRDRPGRPRGGHRPGHEKPAPRRPERPPCSSPSPPSASSS